LKIELKNGTLKVSKPLICEDEKKVRLHFLLTVGKDFANEFYLSMHHANSQIQQLQFFGKSNWNFSGNPSTNVSNSTLYVRNSRIQKIFYVSIHSLKTKRVRMKTCLQCFHSSLRYSATYFHLRLKCCLWTVASGLFKI